MRSTNIVNNSAPPNPSKSIQDERLQNQFEPTIMHEFLEGSRENSQQILRLYQQMERDPILSSSYKDYELNRLEERTKSAMRINLLSRYIEGDSPSDFHRRLNLLAVYDPSTGIRLSINLGLFVNCIKGNGTAAQYKYWCIDKETTKIKSSYGCFGMTELGHGSNVAGCETTATFDEENDEFIINTPHIGATKWWIGGALHVATHCVVYARLIVKGKDYGVKTFVVPLRDSNHDVMPGITIGDIGGKMGREGVDNGWIQFSNVKIPRFFMLQRFCKVSRNGEVELPPLQQLVYISLLGGRVMMAVDSYRISARFITIAIRYAIGRRQFKKEGSNDNDDGLESKLLDYPLHQRRLIPYLALTYAMAVGTKKLENDHAACLKEFDHAVNSNDRATLLRAIETTKSLFIDSASLKSTCTWLAGDCITESRQACGGHGYSAYSGFGKTYGDWTVQCTYEGDNSVLGMSAGKAIISNTAQVINKNKKITGSISFLSNAKNYINNELVLKSDEDLQDLSLILKSLEVLICRLASQSMNILESIGDKDWDNVSYQRVLLSKLRCHHYLLQTFMTRIDTADESTKQILMDVAKTYAYTSILESFSAEFLSLNVISPNFINRLKSNVIPEYLRKLRSQAVALTDSFQQPDMVLNSPVGNYNGDIYENYFKVVKKANPPINTKAPYSGALEAMLNRPSKEERERFEKSAETAKILSN
mmetsp:Transcript_3186/g.3568  ORF Transcript_3186/g.3568 Transcript_3186/m.3568 type:complete len:707 (+) Transcript_3186:120-2240(+)